MGKKKTRRTRRPKGYEGDVGANKKGLTQGDTLHLVGRFEEALTAARIAVKQRPDSHKARFNLGGVILELGKADEALQRIQRDF